MIIIIIVYWTVLFAHLFFGNIFILTFSEVRETPTDGHPWDYDNPWHKFTRQRIKISLTRETEKKKKTRI